MLQELSISRANQSKIKSHFNMSVHNWKKKFGLTAGVSERVDISIEWHSALKWKNSATKKCQYLLIYLSGIFSLEIIDFRGQKVFQLSQNSLSFLFQSSMGCQLCKKSKKRAILVCYNFCAAYHQQQLSAFKKSCSPSWRQMVWC